MGQDYEGKKKNTGLFMNQLSSEQREELLKTLKTRFEQNMPRHIHLDWAAVQARLEANPGKLWSLNEMERTGGEPDVVGHDRQTGEIFFYDCASKSPLGRRNVCYDRAALESRKEHQPKDSAAGMAAAMDIELLTEDQYRALQELGNFEPNTLSWLKTLTAIRQLGGAIFGYQCYNHVFVNHNGADSYYGSRGFRGWIAI
jgi:hypothetical protein